MDPDPNSGPAIFAIDLQDANKKQIKKNFFAYYFESIFTSFSKYKKLKSSNKTVGVKVFLTIFA
jgi:hypothetical protein